MSKQISMAYEQTNYPLTNIAVMTHKSYKDEC